MGKTKDNLVATYSIVGLDPKTGEIGVATQSKFLGVRSCSSMGESKCRCSCHTIVGKHKLGP